MSETYPLPCPFCGTMPAMRWEEEYSRLSCDGMFCKVSPSCVAMSITEVIEAWNKRAEDAK
jgi:hypothetical protein